MCVRFFSESEVSFRDVGGSRSAYGALPRDDNDRLAALGYRATLVTADGASSDGSWCEVGEHTGQVWEAGPTLLWAAVEDAHRRWRDLGEPGWDRFGLTVTPDRQWIWLDAPDGDHSWPLRPLP